MEKTRDLFKKIGDTKGTFHSKMGTVESRNARTLQKQKRQQEYTEKVLMTRITMMVCSTHLESNILECEVKWALENITMNKTSEGDGIPAELFQILKDNAVKVLHSICQQMWKTQQWPLDQKDEFSFQSQRRTIPKNVNTTIELCSFHILQAYAQNPSSQTSEVHKLRTSRCTSQIQKRQRNQRPN